MLGCHKSRLKTRFLGEIIDVAANLNLSQEKHKIGIKSIHTKTVADTINGFGYNTVLNTPAPDSSQLE